MSPRMRARNSQPFSPSSWESRTRRSTRDSLIRDHAAADRAAVCTSCPPVRNMRAARRAEISSSSRMSRQAILDMVWMDGPAVRFPGETRGWRAARLSHVTPAGGGRPSDHREWSGQSTAYIDGRPSILRRNPVPPVAIPKPEEGPSDGSSNGMRRMPLCRSSPP